jgi:hypothetical protein
LPRGDLVVHGSGLPLTKFVRAFFHPWSPMSHLRSEEIMCLVERPLRSCVDSLCS